MATTQSTTIVVGQQYRGNRTGQTVTITGVDSWAGGPYWFGHVRFLQANGVECIQPRGNFLGMFTLVAEAL